jgi:hypothetical protein
MAVSIMANMAMRTTVTTWPFAPVADGAERRHGRGGLHHDDAHDEQFEQAERALQARLGGTRHKPAIVAWLGRTRQK